MLQKLGKDFEVAEVAEFLSAIRISERPLKRHRVAFTDSK
jgi:hypothetical protein